MDYSLTIKLFGSLFSFSRSNMRWFNLKRVLAVVVLLPLFFFYLVINRVFMCVDYILFPAFRKQQIKEPVFIIAAPRSATTYLFHVLGEQTQRFTCFKLWEIIFAPSVIQKYFFKALIKVDSWLGRPLKKTVSFFEQKVFGNFTRIHKIALALPEEDEAILLWNMSTIYLNFFFPDTSHFNAYFKFDDALPTKLRYSIFRYYVNCIKRHNYVFNREGKKTFLSKNPAMMPKVKTLHVFFPDAKILNINRCPSSAIPSTLELNNNIYSFFTSKKASEELLQRTKSILIEWYKMSHRYLHQYYLQQLLRIDFSKLVKGEGETINRISHLLKLGPEIFTRIEQEHSARGGHVSNHKYQTLNTAELQMLLSEVPFLATYCKEKLNEQTSSKTISSNLFSDLKDSL